MTESGYYSYSKGPQEDLNKRKRDFALPNNMMFLNTVVQRVAKEKEVRIATVSGFEQIGFITGLDQEYLQLTTTADQRLVVINLLNLEFIEETGNSLRTLKLDQEKREKIQTYAQTIFVKAKEITSLIREIRSKRAASRAEVDSSTDIVVDDIETDLDD